MKSTIVEIDCDLIIDRETFHDVFSKALGFPEFYGRNMDAWIDCMTCLDAPEDELTSVHAPEGGCVVLQLSQVKSLAVRCREIYDDLVSCAAFVNWRRMEGGLPPVLVLSFND